MAKPPPPPKLKYGGMNIVQQIILRGSLLFAGLFLVLPFVIYLLIGDDPFEEHGSDTWIAWAIFGAIAYGAFHVASGEFWAGVAETIQNAELGTRLHFFIGWKVKEWFWALVGAFILPAVVAALLIGVAVLTTKEMGYIDEVPPDSFALIPASIVGLISVIFFTFKWIKDDLEDDEAIARQEADQGGKGGKGKKPRMEDFIKPSQSEDVKEDEFAFNPSAFADDKTEAKPKQRKTANRSKNTENKSGHHQDDADLWGVVNDAESTPDERKTALELIMEREAQRSASTT